MESNSDTVSSQKGKKEMVSEVDPSNYELVSLCCCHSLDVSCRPRMNLTCPLDKVSVQVLNWIIRIIQSLIEFFSDAYNQLLMKI